MMSTIDGKGAGFLTLGSGVGLRLGETVRVGTGVEVGVAVDAGDE